MRQVLTFLIYEVGVSMELQHRARNKRKKATSHMIAVKNYFSAK
jgi:hypothetical protein